MDEKNDHALKVAEFLLQIKAVELKPDNPFTWASGLKSPIYCDNRKTLSYPKIRTFIRQQFVDVINEHYGKPDVIAGVATGGIALGALVAQELGLPFVYVRSEAKKHGLNNQVEGALEAGQSVVVIEDLISTGMSSLNAVAALRDAQAKVLGMVAIFTYGFEKARVNFEQAKCPLQTLSNYDSLLEQALKSQHITDKQLETLQSWKSNPEHWSALQTA
ncbi:MAG: orotate phosphoribosyltransferase [Flavobacteriales bacterium]|jgi:orotate phosphoribosyltransferase